MRSKSQSSEAENQIVLDWREWDFFRERGGLSAKETVEAEVCYDYELLRESEPVKEQILACPERKTIVLEWVAGYPYLARWAPNLEKGRVCNEANLRHAPFVPSAACLAGWFPSPWLCGSRAERHRIVKLLERAYHGIRPLRLYDLPLDPDFRRLLSNAQSDQAKLFGILIDRRQSHHKLVAQFRQSLAGLGIMPDKKGSPFRRYKGAVYTLQRLGAYRLWRLPLEQRKIIAPGVRASKLSRAVEPIQKDFKERNYWGEIIRLA